MRINKYLLFKSNIVLFFGLHGVSLVFMFVAQAAVASFTAEVIFNNRD